jgi:hypothetical protein
VRQPVRAAAYYAGPFLSLSRLSVSVPSRECSFAGTFGGVFLRGNADLAGFCPRPQSMAQPTTATPRRLGLTARAAVAARRLLNFTLVDSRHASACLHVSSASRAGLLKPRGAAGARAERHDEHFQVTLMATGFLRSTVPNISPADRMLSDRNSSPSQRWASGAGVDRSRGGGGGGAGQLGQTSGQRDGLPAAGRDVRRVENSVTVMYSGA